MAQRMPEDVLRQIFLTLYESTPSDIDSELGMLWGNEDNKLPSGPFSRERVSYTLSAVCSSWRKIVRETPRMWTEVSHAIPLGKGGAESLSAFGLSLTLSLERPISVRLTLSKVDGSSDGLGLSDLFLALVPHLDRVKQLVILVNQGWPTFHNMLMNGDMLGYKKDVYTPKFPRQARTLWLTHPANLVHRKSPFKGFPVTGVKKLVLHHVAFTRVSDLAFMLQNCVNVVELTLLGTNKMLRDEDANTAFDFPSLYRLEIDCDHLRLLTQVGLHTPKLRKLELCKLVSHQDTTHHTNWSFAEDLEHLILVRGWTDHELMHIFHDLNKLRTLGLVNCQAGTLLSGLLILELPPFAQKYGFCLPRLEELTLFGGEIDDEGIQRIIDVRDSKKNPRLETLTFELHGCANISSRTVQTLKRTGRGTCQLAPLNIGRRFVKKRFVMLDPDVFPPPCQAI